MTMAIGQASGPKTWFFLSSRIWFITRFLWRFDLRSVSVARKKRAWFTKNKSCWKPAVTDRCTT